MNQNGQIILKTLEEVDEPATISKIVSHIAQAIKVDAKQIKPAVLDTLSAGVRYGFVQRRNRRYFAEPPFIGNDKTSLNEMKKATNSSEVGRSRQSSRGGSKRRSVGSGDRRRRHRQ